MFSFLWRHRWAVIGLGLASGVLVVAIPHREDPLVSRPSVALVGAGAQSVVSGAAHSLASVVERYLLLAGAEREAGLLRKQNAELRKELLAVWEVAQENRRLRALLRFKESAELPLVPARVVSRSASTWFRTLVLDKGTDDGISRDCPVVTPEGVVGKIYQVGSSWSRVLLITDTSSAVDGLIQRTRAPVVVEGRLEAACRILYLARADGAVVGDRVVTSGLGGIFPKGLLVGEINRVEAAKAGVFQAAELRTSVDLARVEEVFVGLPPPAGST
ncbi:MAG: rod shape-determining protein MreC [Deltaproteobacteria bacterium]|nr:rod shape-determining protein MreC [Deltaproteobacteria bacterium]